MTAGFALWARQVWLGHPSHRGGSAI